MRFRFKRPRKNLPERIYNLKQNAGFEGNSSQFPKGISTIFFLQQFDMVDNIVNE